jgi:transposase
MIDVKRILELHPKCSQNEIVATINAGKHSVSSVIKIAKERNITYEQVKDLPDKEAYHLFYPDKNNVDDVFYKPDYEMIHNELKKDGVTLQLLYSEYHDEAIENAAFPMGKTKFYEGYRAHCSKYQLTNRMQHKPGVSCEVDWAGDTMSWTDATGEKHLVYLFVGTLPWSMYTYVRPCQDMKMANFIQSHVFMYEYFGGVPMRTVCDNLKTGVVSHPKNDDIILTDDYRALGTYYQTAILPTRVRKPRDKSSVESSVDKIANKIIGMTRKDSYYSYESLVLGVVNALEKLNDAPFQKREGSRKSVWEEEKQFLQPLPPERYEMFAWVKGRLIDVDSCVAFETNRYSVPYKYYKKCRNERKVDLRVSDTIVEIYRDGARIASHLRCPSYVRYRSVINKEHFPDGRANEENEWTENRLVEWGASIGEGTREVIKRIFETAEFPPQAIRPSLSVLNLAKKYSEEQLENACRVCLARKIRSPRYKHVNAVLSSSKDLEKIPETRFYTNADSQPTGYVRGTRYYQKNPSETSAVDSVVCPANDGVDGKEETT